MEDKTTTDLQFAIFGCPEEITAEMYQEVLGFAERVRNNTSNKQSPLKLNWSEKENVSSQGLTPFV